MPATKRGSFTILTLFLILTMLFVTGLGVDVVRYEARRAKVQNTLDRAILAAADLSQTMTPKEVVDEYFAKAGVPADVTDPVVVQSWTSKQVSATATSTIDTFFMKMFGIDTLTPAAAGVAEETISNVEISLVLDISGSMNDPIYVDVEGYDPRYGSYTYRQNSGVTKIQSLRNSASEFVDTIFGSTAQARTSMSVVPYASQVEVGSSLLAYYNVTTQHNYNTCVDFNTADFNSPQLLTTQLLTRSDHLDVWDYTVPPALTVCDTKIANAVVPLGSDPTTLKSKINGLDANGNTSVDIGMKWGAALLDPSARPAVTGLISQGKIGNDYAGRPEAYDDTQTMKVIVVMTDGHNTEQYKLNSNYKSQMSGVYKYISGGQTYFSVKQAEGSNTDRDGDGKKNEAYWLENECVYNGCGNSGSKNPKKWDSAPKGGNAAVQLTYQQVWAEMSVPYHAYYLRYAIFGNSNDYYNWVDNPVTYVDTGTKDTRLTAMCNAAKTAGIIVFAIGFEVADAEVPLMKSCASSPSHFYRVQGLEITTAFQSIANAIGKLRLTQ